MPSRVIRDALVESRSLSRVSLEAELLFVHLLLVVDDYGRFDARPEVIASRCFPTRRTLDLAQVVRWLEELCAEGCVRRYEVEGEWYLELTGWDRHRGKQKRADRSKYPTPPPLKTQENAPRRSPEIPGDPRRSERLASIEHRASSGEHREVPSEPSSAFADRDPPGGGEIPWEAVESAFAAYGRRPRARSPARRRALAARLREASPEALPQAVHGYMALHGRRDGGNGFDPLAHLTPETVFRAGNFPKYVEAYERAVAQGRSPPFRPETAEERLDRAIAEDP